MPVNDDARPQIARQKNRATRGRVILFPKPAAKTPRRPGCVVYHLHHCSEASALEPCGWWAIRVGDDCGADVKGPFNTERRAAHVARQWAARCGCTFIP